MEEQEYTLLDTIKGIAVVVWFFGSMIAMVLFAKTSPWLVLAVFGQVFFIAGIMVFVDGFKKKNFQPLFLLFLLIGALAVAYGIVMTYADADTQKSFMDMVVYAILGVFFATGVLSLFSVVWRNALEKKCTYPVRAVCISIRKHSSMTNTNTPHYRTRTYCPVFSFTYNGKIYEVCNHEYTNFVNAQPGKEYELLINPDRPYIFHEPGESARLNTSYIVFGIIFVAVSTATYIILSSV